MKRIVVALAFALAACGQQAEQKQEEAFPVINAPEANSSIGPGGAAGIHSPLPMDPAAIRAAAPNFMVASVQDQIEGNPFTAITLSAGDEEVFRVFPTADGAHIHSIVTRSGQARGPEQDIVGVATFALAPADEVTFCAAEQFDGSAGFACSTAEDGNFWRVYRVPEAYDGPSEPFDAIDPDVLHDSTLVEMRWVAPRV